MNKMAETSRPEPLGFNQTAEALADQGVAYVKYQQALVFVYQGSAFNSLTVLSLWPVLETFADNGTVFVPNVVGRPVRVKSESGLLNTAKATYSTACALYEQDTEEIRKRFASLVKVVPEDDEPLPPQQ